MGEANVLLPIYILQSLHIILSRTLQIVNVSYFWKYLNHVPWRDELSVCHSHSCCCSYVQSLEVFRTCCGQHAAVFCTDCVPSGELSHACRVPFVEHFRTGDVPNVQLPYARRVPFVEIVLVTRVPSMELPCAEHALFVEIFRVALVPCVDLQFSGWVLLVELFRTACVPYMELPCGLRAPCVVISCECGRFGCWRCCGSPFLYPGCTS